MAHKGQMALCPNCHAIKAYGTTAEQLCQELLRVARERHDAMLRKTCT